MVGDFWKPTNAKQVSMPTTKVCVAYALTSSPMMTDFIDLNKELDAVIMGMAAGFKDLKAPCNQREAYKIAKEL